MAEWLTPAIIAAFVSIFMSSLVSILITYFRHRSEERAELLSQFQEMIRLALLYPHVDDPRFCRLWSGEPREIKDVQYDTYCCFVFNVLERTWRHFHGNRQKIQRFAGVGEIIRMHQKWWLSFGAARDNIDGYSNPGFRQFVESYCRKENES